MLFKGCSRFSPKHSVNLIRPTIPAKVSKEKTINKNIKHTKTPTKGGSLTPHSIIKTTGKTA